MEFRNARRFTATSWIPVLFLTFLPMFSQQVALDVHDIREDEKGFVVEGTVVMSNLNPGEQIVERDDCYVNIDIMKGAGSVFPELPDSMVIRPPATAETNYTKGGRFLSKNERDGIGMILLPIAHFIPRKTPVWREYGGTRLWRKSAPNCATSEFSGIIPKEHAGKRVRIRATLMHEWGGPNAAWSAYSFHHDVGHMGVLQAGSVEKPDEHRIYIEKGPEGAPNPVPTAGRVQCRVLAKDTHGHPPLYEWRAFPSAGSFSDPTSPEPIWTPPENTMDQIRSYTLSCTVICPEVPSLRETGSYLQEVCPAVRPVSLMLRISAKGFETYEKSTETFAPRYERITLTGSVMPAYRSSDEAGVLGAGQRVLAELIVMSDGREIRKVNQSLEMYQSYWLAVDLTGFSGCTKSRHARRNRNVRLHPLDGQEDGVASKENISSDDIYNKILSKALEKKGAERIWQLLGLYKAFENDKAHIASGGEGTPAMDVFFKNMRDGRIGEIKNAVNTLWEFTKDPLTLGGSAIEDMIQNTNRAYERIFGKGFLRSSGGGPNAIRDAGVALRRKLEEYRKIAEGK